MNDNEDERRQSTRVLLEQIILFQIVYNLVQIISNVSRGKELSAKVISYLPHY